MELEQLKAELKSLGEEYAKMKTLAPEERKAFGQALNQKKQAVIEQIKALEAAKQNTAVKAIDLTAPFDVNQSKITFHRGSRHPLMIELDRVIDIYSRMGFEVMESTQLDDEFHMFESLNFPEGHPARDGYDTFRTKEGFIPPAHTSTMQYRALTSRLDNLEKDGQIAVVIPGRVFRNEDVDATHEHTFYQCEGVFVSKTANMSEMLGVLKNFFETYYGEKLRIKTQPGFFPFTEPSLELLVEKPASLGGKGDGWLELMGCGMIHPNVLKAAGIDPEIYHGFAWGGGIDRLVIMKYHLSDIRFFESAKLEFLEEF